MKRFTIICVLFLLSIKAFSQTTVQFNVYLQDSLRPISNFIFGSNSLFKGDENITAHRQGGNRMTGYNWENNASNAGADWYHQSDNYLTSGLSNENVPGIVTTNFHDKSLEKGMYSLVTLQMAGFVAKDKSGIVTEAQTAPSSRWAEVKFEKQDAFALQPDLTDNFVYMDEYVNFLVNKYGNGVSLAGIKGYSLDNEPDLWQSTHPRIHPSKTGCKELIERGTALSLAVKKVDPYAEIFGYASYGFNGFTTFQDAPDWNTVKAGKSYNWFIDYYLDEMKKAETTAGIRLLDVLDVHWYPEAIGDHRITESDATTAADIAARLQAPRTLWDAKYIENSWIGTWGKTNLPLIPKLKASINKYYPGTKLSFTEFTYGGENHISGGIAAADVLGIFVKYDIYFASFWPVGSNQDYISAAYKIYRNYDGNNSTFGDLYIPSFTSDSTTSSIYSSLDDMENLHLIVINKDLNNIAAANFSVSNTYQITEGKVWCFDKLSSTIRQIEDVENLSANSFTYNLPAGSVSHFVIKTSPNTLVENEPSTYDLKLSTFPNPFNLTCKIRYGIPENMSNSKIEIYDLLGRLIKTFNSLSKHGEVIWDGTNNFNQVVSSGTYLVTLRGKEQRVITQKVLLVK